MKEFELISTDWKHNYAKNVLIESILFDCDCIREMEILNHMGNTLNH